MKQARRKVMIRKQFFYEELEHVFEHFPKYHMKILVGDFYAKLGREVNP